MGNAARNNARNRLSGGLAGIGFVAFVDEAVFHQLLHWHHFYDKATTSLGLVSDGLFHAFSWFATVMGLVLLADLRRKGAWQPHRWWGAALAGGGIFQLYDGTIQHKLMQIHQIRYVENVAVYDWAWNIVAAAMIVAGLLLATRAVKPRKAGHAR